MAKNTIIDIADAYNVPLFSVLLKGRPRGNTASAQKAAIYVLYEYELKSAVTIGKHFDLNSNHVHHIIRTVSERIGRRDFAPMLQVIEKNYRGVRPRHELEKWELPPIKRHSPLTCSSVLSTTKPTISESR